tara:strand:+ start:1244 stop:2272 length:1029 start_codon:yes stop_codon:yes gene_type:complete
MRAIVFLFILLLFIKPVSSNEILYSEEYKIEFSSNDITKKKEEIINEIKYDSFRKIITSLITNYEYKKINKTIDIDFINTFVFGIDISEEKINNNTYTSKIKFAYDNSKIIDFFINNNIHFIPYEPERYLIIIFDQKLFSEKILSKDNQFYKFLNDNKLKYKFFNVPNLDINDRYIIKKEDFFLKKINNYDELIDKYKNKNILLIHSITDSNEVKIFSYVYDYNNFQILDNVTYKKIDYELFFNSLHNKTLDYWKNKNIVNPLLINKINCKINTLNLAELKTIKKIIHQNKMIKQITTNEISYNNSNYELVYFGDLDILVKSLNKDKIHLKFLDNLCDIKTL